MGNPLDERSVGKRHKVRLTQQNTVGTAFAGFHHSRISVPLLAYPLSPQSVCFVLIGSVQHRQPLIALEHSSVFALATS
jgi:hypothetical protein